jgi:flagellar protein FliT
MNPSLIDYYKAIEDSSMRLREAAEQENWDLVMRLEGVCVVLIEQLRAKARVCELSADERREKALIMQRILINDAHIRAITEPWLNFLDTQPERGAQVLLH